MGDAGVLDIGLIGGIVEDEGVVFQGVVHPFAQLLFGDDGTRGVVGIAEIDDVHPAVGYLGHEMVFGRAGHIGHVAPFAVLHHTGPANHHVGVDVDGIDGVGHTDTVVPSHEFLDVARIALGTIVDEYLARVEMDAAGQIVVLHDGLTQEGVALFGTVAVERFALAQVVDGLVHGLHDGGTKRLGDIADAQTDYVGMWMAHFEGIHLLGDVGEQIVVRQFQEMFVY